MGGPPRLQAALRWHLRSSGEGGRLLIRNLQPALGTSCLIPFGVFWARCLCSVSWTVVRFESGSLGESSLSWSPDRSTISASSYICSAILFRTLRARCGAVASSQSRRASIMKGGIVIAFRIPYMSHSFSLFGSRGLKLSNVSSACISRRWRTL